MSSTTSASTITIAVQLDENKVPDTIRWSATDSSIEDMQAVKGMLLSLWDGADKAALRIDLWTKDMMVDEMIDFYYQCFMGMADSLQRSTGQQLLVDDLKLFAQSFFKKFQELQQNGSR